MNPELLSVPFELFWVAFGVAAAAMFPILGLLKRLKSRQTISQYVPEHMAKQGTPTMGGLIALAGTIAAVLGGLALEDRNVTAELTTYLVLIVLFGLIGFVDDFLVPRIFVGTRGLGWKQKIIMEVAAAAIPVLMSPHMNIVEGLIAIVVILFFANAYNFVDGLDGLAGSVGIVLVAGVAGLSLLGGGAPAVAVVLLTLALIGGLIPFLFLNAPPAKLFMGDVGALPIGAVIGWMAWRIIITSEFRSYNIVGLLLMSLVMFVALVPVPLQIASVKLRKKRIFPKTPIHHAFQEKGIPETRIVGAYVLCQGLATMAGLSLAVWLHSVASVSLSVASR